MVQNTYTHIKRVQMVGFRSYKDQNIDGVETFSKHTNVIGMLLFSFFIVHFL